MEKKPCLLKDFIEIMNNKLKSFTLSGFHFLQFIATTIFSGYVLSTLWSWFVAPTFDVAALNIPSAIGVMLVARYVTQQLHYSDFVYGRDEEAKKIVDKFLIK